MVNVLIIALVVLGAIWLGILLTTAWLSALNFLLDERVLSQETNQTTWGFVKHFIATPFLVSIVVVGGLVTKFLKFAVKET